MEFFVFTVLFIGLLIAGIKGVDLLIERYTKKQIDEIRDRHLRQAVSPEVSRFYRDRLPMIYDDVPYYLRGMKTPVQHRSDEYHWGGWL